MARKEAAPSIVASIPRVNLLPRAEVDRRDRAFVIRRWGWGVVAAMAVVVLVAAGTYGMNWAAQQRLAEAQSRTSSLTTQIAELKDVSSALKTKKDLETFRAQAMAGDIDYIKTLTSLAAVLPATVEITGFELTSGGVPVAGADPKSAPGLVGTITLASPDPLEVVSVIRSFRKVAGVTTADGKEVKSKDDTGAGGPYIYTLTVQFNQTVYSGVYATKAGS